MELCSPTDSDTSKHGVCDRGLERSSPRSLPGYNPRATDSPTLRFHTIPTTSSYRFSFHISYSPSTGAPIVQSERVFIGGYPLKLVFLLGLANPAVICLASLFLRLSTLGFCVSFLNLGLSGDRPLPHSSLIRRMVLPPITIAVCRIIRFFVPLFGVRGEVHRRTPPLVQNCSRLGFDFRNNLPQHDPRSSFDRIAYGVSDAIS